MRIALICDDYLPDSTRVSAKMMHELACELLQLGHSPIVICPTDMSKELEIIELDGITVYKFPNGTLKDVAKFRRAINESCLSFNAWRILRKRLCQEKIDGIIYYSPSIFFGPFVRKLKTYWNCKSYLILRDSFPQWLVDQNIIRKNGVIEKYFRYFEKLNYNAADCIGLMSDKNKEIFKHNYGDNYFIQTLYNWADFKGTKDICASSLRKQLALECKVIFFYGGNIGHAQDMHNLLRLAKAMSCHPEAHFLFIGQGDEVSLVQSFIEQNALTNCTYLPSISQDEFKSVLKVVDVGLFSLAKKHSVHNFPGKLLGYMANKIPILGSVNENNDLMLVINDASAGIVHVNGDDEALIASAKKLVEDSQLRKNYGENAFALLQDKFSVEVAAVKILEKLFG
ncbi:glycosyltransferase family 4 protein [Citrobacter amalonaticus]|uniref:glycosyltransferase family 4 protein n=1 Tax=Citrobacter amalonaticus TaxID=35703 RepID=UPI00300DAF1E